LLEKILINSRLTKKLISLALDEDLAYGDITSSALVNCQALTSAKILAGEDLVICGVEIAHLVFQELDTGSSVKCLPVVRDGQKVSTGDCLVELAGPAALLFAGERTVLNFMQRLSGIATHTRTLVDNYPQITFLDTRKTTPGWRVLEKYAVRVGGGENHRLHLADMVLIKNNHLDYNDSELELFFQRVKKLKPFYTPVQIEVRNLSELKRIAVFEPDSILLDNMSPHDTKSCISWIKDNLTNCLIESSGRISVENIESYIVAGVRTVSTSNLIHGAKPSDLKLRIC
jgi:nicotinate-nucleotide pyrophosphorylase (carboxylating)